MLVLNIIQITLLSNFSFRVLDSKHTASDCLRAYLISLQIPAQRPSPSPDLNLDLQIPVVLKPQLSTTNTRLHILREAIE